jgi:CRP-like cAMP-binding protein
MTNYLTNFYLENKEYNHAYFYDFIIKKQIKGSEITELIIKKKETLEFPSGKYMYFIRHGSIKESTIDWAGNVRTIRILTKNDILLYSDLVEKNASLCFLQTLSDTKIYQIPLSLLKGAQTYDIDFLPFNYQLNSKIYFLKWFYASTNGEKRVYSALIEVLLSLVTEPIEINTKESFLLPAYITHEIISEISGVSRSYVTRIIERLKEKKIIDYTNNAIKIIDLNYFSEQLMI